MTMGTIRYKVRISLGGQQIRLRFSNEYSDSPLELAAASIGIAGDALDAASGAYSSDRERGFHAIVNSHVMWAAGV